MRGDREPRLTQGGAGSGGGYVRPNRKIYILRRVLLVAALLLLAFTVNRACQSLVGPEESSLRAPDEASTKDGDSTDASASKDAGASDEPEENGLAGISPKSPLDPPEERDDEAEDGKEKIEDEASSANVVSTETAETDAGDSDDVSAKVAGTETTDVTGFGEDRDVATATSNTWTGRFPADLIDSNNPGPPSEIIAKEGSPLLCQGHYQPFEPEKEQRPRVCNRDLTPLFARHAPWVPINLAS